ncbi:2Fe-2S iron-sulfur cluster-binding protein [Sphingomonas sp. 37zxx]|uniref:2Fe-2S iron-sulfur cluster-binding protein n=1 Tax=Sphingomonas sp. 37zxx TaxID=1550073 RepID=UPI00053BF9BE|nr:2Fe-2S iron-sulfur cluster-binding protein [Sphingomonas sp. 37zxx]
MALTLFFRDPDGSVREVRAHAGQSLMMAALNAGIRRIEAQCGGAMACGTCAVRIGAAWRAQVGEPLFLEEAMLELTGKQAAGTRLSCQVQLSAALDGLEVDLPESQ